jgi:hypothetical protein
MELTLTLNQVKTLLELGQVYQEIVDRPMASKGRVVLLKNWEASIQWESGKDVVLITLPEH